MKVSSIDIETTGTIPGFHQLIQFAIILDDFSKQEPLDRLPKFKCYIAHDHYNIDAKLASKNDVFHTLEIIGKISKMQQTKEFKLNGVAFDENGEMYVSPFEISGILYNFFEKHNQLKDEAGKFVINAAGKNVGSFDIPFINNTFTDLKSYFTLSYRTLDPTILFMDPLNDEELPNLTTCKERAGFKKTEVSHDAFEDALDIVSLLRYHFSRKLESIKK